jgi:protein phosphatase
LAIARGGRDNVTAVVVQAEDPYASEKTLLNPAP